MITALLDAVAPGLVQPGVKLDPEDLAPTQLDSLPPELDADFVTRVGQQDLLHVECQGYRDGKFEERALWYHVGFAFRHRGKRRVRTVAFWLVRPPGSYPRGPVFSVHDITVKVTSVVLEDVPASVLLADPRTACLAAGAAAEGRTSEQLCAEVARVLAANNATFAERHMAAVAALMRGRYKEMVMAMDAANLAPVIIEDLVKYGEDLGIEKGMERGMEKGLEQGIEKGVRASLRRVLAARKIVLTPEQEQRIESCTDLQTLHHWLDGAVVALTASEALQ